jgi:SAM-dependent methyltransferase
MNDSDRVRVEEERIRRTYAARGDAGRYSWLTAGHQLIMQSAERGLLQALARSGRRTLQDATVLEVGCGTGHWLRSLVQWGAAPERIVGLDLLPDRIAVARRTCAAPTRLVTGSAAALPFPDRSFDIVLQSTVFTSMLDADVRRAAAAEMLRVLRADGIVLWYDFFVDNPRNPNVRGVGKDELRRLFPGCRIDVRRVTLAPPLARAVAPRSWLAASLLSAVPALCTHYAGTIRR